MQSRKREPELMDDPLLSHAEQLQARSGLARINVLTGTATALWKPIQDLAKAEGLSQLKVLDVATGDGDVLLRLWRIARQSGLSLQADGCDICDSAIKLGAEAATHLSAPSKFFKLDVLHDAIPRDYDVVMTSLFTHHLSEDETVKLLKSMKESTRHMVLVMDLVRSNYNHAMIWLTTRLLSRSRVVHFDGPASVRNSYTPDEMRALAERAGLHGAEIKELFPCRMMLIWRKANGSSR